MPSFTFVSTANAFVLRGARPVFVDIRPDTLNLDERAARGARSRRGRGPSCRCTTPASAARWTRSWRSRAAHGLAVVEDNAHGLFGTYRGRPLGTLRRAGDAELPRDEEHHLRRGRRAAHQRRSATSSAPRSSARRAPTASRFFRGRSTSTPGWTSARATSRPTSSRRSSTPSSRRATRSRRSAGAIWERYARELPPLGRRPRHPPAVRPRALRAALPHVLPAHCRRSTQRTRLHRAPEVSAASWPSSTTCRCTSPRWAGASAGKPGDCPVTEDLSDRLLRLPFYNDLGEAEQAYVIESLHAFAV